MQVTFSNPTKSTFSTSANCYSSFPAASSSRESSTQSCLPAPPQTVYSRHVGSPALNRETNARGRLGTGIEPNIWQAMFQIC